MKLITIIFSVFSVFCISIYSVSSGINEDAKKWETFGEKRGEHKKVYIDFSEQNSEKIYEILTNAARKNNINLVRKGAPYGDSKITNSLFLGNSDIKLIDDKELVSGNFFSKENTEENAYISTSRDDKALGRICSFLNWNHVEIGTLKRLLESGGSMSGEYTVRYASFDDYDNFLENLSEEFKVSRDELTEKKFGCSTAESRVITFSRIFMAISVVLAAITTMFYSIKSLKSVGIMKLCGYSLEDISKKVFGSIFIANFIFSIIFDISLVVVFKTAPFSFLVWLFYQQCFVSFLILLAMVPSIFIVKKYRISDLIYDRNPVKVINGLNFCVKCVLLCVLMMSSSSLPGDIKKLPLLVSEINKWEKISNFAIIDHEGDYMDALQDFRENRAKRTLEYKEILDHFNKRDSLYCRFNVVEIHSDFLKEMRQRRIFDFDDELLKLDFNFKTMTVNPSYFKKFNAKGLDGKIFNFSDDENQRIILRPASSSFSEDLVKKVYDFNLGGIIREENYKYSKEVKVMTYDDSVDEFCTFSKRDDERDFEHGQKHDLFEKSLFFEIVPAKLMTEFEFSFVLLDDKALKISFGNESLADFNERTKKEFEEIGIDKNRYKLSSVRASDEFQLDNMKKILAMDLCILALFLILVILISFSLTKFYIETYKKVIGVKKIHGFSVVNCHKNYFILLFVSSIFAASLVCYCAYLNFMKASKAPSNAGLVFSIPRSIVFMGFFVALFDFLISYTIVKFYEKRRLSDILKGA
ncbi:MAG: DUF1430 domain-containing protein [Oscillospiraceae bacterium]|jgi:hypothetical protein|nr:DUF1430 domain-containing protein [Oscillospiraceae bacterium]